MKTAFKARVVIDTDKYSSVYGGDGDPPLTLQRIKDEANAGNFSLEWISSDLDGDGEPVLIFTIK